MPSKQNKVKNGIENGVHNLFHKILLCQRGRLIKAGIPMEAIMWPSDNTRVMTVEIECVNVTLNFAIANI